MNRNTAAVVSALRSADIDVPDDVDVQRTYAPRREIENGLWSWYLVDATGRRLNIGSPYALRECAAAAKRGHLAVSPRFASEKSQFSYAPPRAIDRHMIDCEVAPDDM